MHEVSNFGWNCPYCGTHVAEQHALDCKRNDTEVRKIRELYGQCLPGGYAIDRSPSTVSGDYK